MKSKIVLVFLFISATMSAQEIEPIQADRPDQTETPSIVPVGMFQVETGFTFQKNDALYKKNSLPTALWKYGVTKNFEFRLITEFLSEEIINENVNGFSPIYIGFKVALTEENGIVPKTSFIGHIGLPKVASNEYKTDFVFPKFRFVMQHSLSNKMSFSYNLGAEWDGFSPEPTFIYTVTTGYSITEKLGSYIELFGFIPQIQQSNHSFDGGITYLINDNFMLDLSSGIGISENAPKNYIAFGFSYRR